MGTNFSAMYGNIVYIYNYVPYVAEFLFGGENVGKQVGRPPIYKTVNEIEEKIDTYFKECEGEILKDDNGINLEIRWLLIESLQQ